MIAEKANKSGRREKSQQHGARNLDGSLKVERTIERSRFLRTQDGRWAGGRALACWGVGGGVGAEELAPGTGAERGGAHH